MKAFLIAYSLLSVSENDMILKYIKPLDFEINEA